jgi:hypothetical protein
LNFVRVYELSKTPNSKRVLDLSLPLRTIYLLAAPSTPPAARDEVIERASNGESLDHGTVKDIVENEKAASGTARPSSRSRRHNVVPPKCNGHGVATPKPTILEIWESWTPFEQRAVLAAMPHEQLLDILPAGIGDLPVLPGPTHIATISAPSTVLDCDDGTGTPVFLSRRNAH